MKKLPTFKSESLDVEVQEQHLIFSDKKSVSSIEKEIFVSVVPSIIDLLKHIPGGRIVGGDTENDIFYCFIFENILHQFLENRTIQLKQFIGVKEEFPDLMEIEDISQHIPEGINILSYDVKDFLNFCKWFAKKNFINDN